MYFSFSSLGLFEICLILYGKHSAVATLLHGISGGNHRQKQKQTRKEKRIRDGKASRTERLIRFTFCCRFLKIPLRLRAAPAQSAKPVCESAEKPAFINKQKPAKRQRQKGEQKRNVNKGHRTPCSLPYYDECACRQHRGDEPSSPHSRLFHIVCSRLSLLTAYFIINHVGGKIVKIINKIILKI